VAYSGKTVSTSTKDTMAAVGLGPGVTPTISMFGEDVYRHKLVAGSSLVRSASSVSSETRGRTV
jgi:hypothetical protein